MSQRRAIVRGMFALAVLLGVVYPCYKVAQRAAGLREVRFHDLRHMAVRAFPITDVQMWMRHADIGTTRKHVPYAPRSDAAKRLGALVDEQLGAVVRIRPAARPQLTANRSSPTKPGSPSRVGGALPLVSKTRHRKGEKVKRCQFTGKTNAGGGTRTPDTRMIPVAFRVFTDSGDVGR